MDESCYTREALASIYAMLVEDKAKQVKSRLTESYDTETTEPADRTKEGF